MKDQKAYQHNCIKKSCGKQYSDTDPDVYYCPDCAKEAKAIAAKVDKQLGSRPSRRVVSPLQEYENAPKVNGFMRIKL